MTSREDIEGVWEAHAQAWCEWARTPGQDVFYSHMNLPAFETVLPAAGRRTLDVGCGEGRVGRRLADLGHYVAGIDSSPTLTGPAREAGGYDEVVCGDARELPWEADEFDLAVAFMSLHDMSDPASVLDEIARVLEAGGALCLMIVHPLNRPEEHVEDYFSERRYSVTVEHHGLSMTFEGIDRPLEAYTAGLARAGFVIEELCEPHASAEAVAAHPELAPAARRPYSLVMRCRLTPSR